MAELFVLIAKGLFYLNGGAPLLNSIILLLGWFVFCSVLFLPTFNLPVYMGQKYKTTFKKITLFLFAIICAIAGTFLSIGVPLTQEVMLKECETVIIQVEIEKIGTTETEFEICREKENYYEDFGEWKIKGSKK